MRYSLGTDGLRSLSYRVSPGLKSNHVNIVDQNLQPIIPVSFLLV